MHGVKMELYQNRVKPPSQDELDQAQSEINKLLKQKQAALKNGKRRH